MLRAPARRAGPDPAAARRHPALRHPGGEDRAGAGRGRVRLGRLARRARRDRGRQDRRPPLPVHPGAARGGVHLHGVGPHRHPAGSPGGGAERAHQAAPGVHRRRHRAAALGGGPGRGRDRERPAAPAAGRTGGGAGAVRGADGRMAGTRAPPARRGDPRRDQPAHREPVLPPVGRGRRHPRRPRGRRPSRSRWRRNWPPPRWTRPGPRSPGCARRYSTTSGWPPAWRAWATRSRSSTCRSRPPAAGWPSTSRPPSTAPRRKRCRTRPSTRTRRSVRVRLYLQRDKMVLEVADDGTGFDPAAVGAGGRRRRGAAMASQPTGFGLAAMRERAELLGGRLELASAPGRGTTVRLSIPYLPAAQCSSIQCQSIPGLGRVWWIRPDEFCHLARSRRYGDSSSGRRRRAVR